VKIVTDDLGWLADRPDWTVEGRVATYAPGSGWLARVRPATQPGKTYQRWHVALVDPTGHAVWTTFCTTASEAMRVAEGHVRGRGSVG
jgi:hypothetical protein